MLCTFNGESGTVFCAAAAANAALSASWYIAISVTVANCYTCACAQRQ